MNTIPDFLVFARPLPPEQTLASTKKVMHRTSTTCSTDSGEQSDSEDETISSSPKVPVQARRMSLSAGAASRLQHFGSFYLRMGAVGKQSKPALFGAHIISITC